MENSEKETIISWNAEESHISVYTCQKSVWKKIERYGYKADEVFELEGKVEAKSFTLPKRCISIRSGKPRQNSTKNAQNLQYVRSFKKKKP